MSEENEEQRVCQRRRVDEVTVVVWEADGEYAANVYASEEAALADFPATAWAGVTVGGDRYGGIDGQMMLVGRPIQGLPD